MHKTEKQILSTYYGGYIALQWWKSGEKNESYIIWNKENNWKTYTYSEQIQIVVIKPVEILYVLRTTKKQTSNCPAPRHPLEGTNHIPPRWNMEMDVLKVIAKY